MNNVVILALLATLGGCATLNPSTCTPSDKARIEADAEATYTENVVIKCAAYSSLAECPAVPALSAQRDADRKKAEIPCR